MTVFFSASRLPREAIFTLARVNALSTLPERNEGLLVVYLGRCFFLGEVERGGIFPPCVEFPRSLCTDD